MPALVIGTTAGVVCYLACSSLKGTLGYDDSLDAFGVHGIGGTLGAVLTGVFASTQVNPGGADGLYYELFQGASGGMQLLVGQAVAAIVTIGYAIVVTFVLIKILDVTMGLRVSQEEEIRGLDLAAHGEEGYIFS
jgi:Amt family ammonium transporter